MSNAKKFDLGESLTMKSSDLESDLDRNAFMSNAKKFDLGESLNMNSSDLESILIETHLCQMLRNLI